MLAVRMTVRAFIRIHVHRSATEVVVLVVGSGGSNLAKSAGHVAEQQWFIFIYPDCRRCVTRKDSYLAKCDAGIGNYGDYIVRNVVEFRSAPRFDLQRLAGYCRL